MILIISQRTTYLRGRQCRTKFSTIKQQTIFSSKFYFTPKLKKNSNIKFKIPALIPPTDRTSKIIQYRYVITVSGGNSNIFPFLIMKTIYYQLEIFQIKARKADQTSHLIFASVDLPITIGTIPFDDSTSATASRLRATTVPSAPPFDLPYDIWPYQPRLMGPSAPEYPDDDTVSIRTYASTPPPFPDDGKNDSARNNSFSYMVDNIQ